MRTQTPGSSFGASFMTALVLLLSGCGAAEVGNDLPTSSSAHALSSGDDGETRRCGDYGLYGYVFWEYVHKDYIRIKEVCLTLDKADYTQQRNGLDYSIQLNVKSEGGARLWSSGAHSISGHTVCYHTPDTHCGDPGTSCLSLADYYSSKDARPYVHFLGGKDGDGVSSCSFNIFPLERG